MPEPTCPSCGAALEKPTPHHLARCNWCGALLAGGSDANRPLVARPRLDASRARVAVARALAHSGRSWLPGGAQLVFYPFAATGTVRRPFAPLAHVPPLLIHGWRPGTADLLPYAGATSAGVMSDGAVRVPVSLPLDAPVPVVHYPFFRVLLRQEGRDSAAWCDAATGQVILPPELAEPPAKRRGSLAFDAVTALALGAAVGILMPFPFALLPLGAIGAAVLWRVNHR